MQTQAVSVERTSPYGDYNVISVTHFYSAKDGEVARVGWTARAADRARVLRSPERLW
jgi:hypothetical protein